MKAVRVHAPGGPEALRYEDVEVPTAGEGQAVVKIAASGLNFIDVQFRAGKYPPPATPFTLGMEGAGTVSAVGPGVTGLAVGDRVAYTMVVGTYADYAVVPARAPRAAAGARGLQDRGRRDAAGHDGALPDVQHVSPEAWRYGARACRGRRRGTADRPGGAHPRRARDRHGRHGGQGGAGARGWRRRRHPLHRAGLRGRGEEADRRPRRGRGLRLGGEGHLREEPQLPAAARPAGAVRVLQRRGAAVRSRRSSAPRGRCS